MKASNSLQVSEARSRLRSLVSQMPNKNRSGSKRDLLLEEYEDNWIYESTPRSMPLQSDLSDTAIFAEFERSLRQSLEGCIRPSAFSTSSSLLLDDSDEENDALVEITENSSAHEDEDVMRYRSPSKPDPLHTSKSLSNSSNHTVETVDMNSSMRLCDIFDGEASSLDSQGTFHHVHSSNGGNRRRDRQRQHSSLRDLFA